MNKVLLSRFSAFAVVGALSLAFALPGVAQETKKKHPSDRTVDFLKTFVEGFLIPDEIPLKDGKKIKVNREDKAEMSQFAIPRDDMRRIIRIAHSGANAEICDRIDLQQSAYSWMRGEEHKKQKWSNRQLFFISRLYVATVMWQTGQASVILDGEKTEKVGTASGPQEESVVKKAVCTDTKREGVKRLEAFLKDKGALKKAKKKS